MAQVERLVAPLILAVAVLCAGPSSAQSISVLPRPAYRDFLGGRLHAPEARYAPTHALFDQGSWLGFSNASADTGKPGFRGPYA